MVHKRVNYPLTLITALLLILVAVLTGSALLVLRQLHGKAAHNAATEMVFKQGRTMASRLASLPIVNSTNSDSNWQEFSHLVRSLYGVESGLQYVSVTRDNMVIFHEQTRNLDGTLPRQAPPPKRENVGIQREILHIGSQTVPVVVFTATTQTGSNQPPTTVRVALRKDTVIREERTAGTAITSMFQLSLLTVLVSFGICVALVAWMMRREAQREEQRRKEEHLAFSGMLANGIVHDFRNPMSAVRLDVQMLQREAERDEMRRERIHKLASRIVNTIDRMDRVFKEFLYVSRPDSESREKLDIMSCIRDTIDMLAPKFERAGVKTELISDYAELYVLAYEGSLRRTLANILTNAEQFSPPSGIVTIRVGSSDTEAIVEVCDEGPGIPPNRRKKVFEMFETSRPEGTGLGLFIAKAAIERSGGSIAAMDITKGANIRITLPLAAE